jgi:hypothetical protein
MRAMAKDVLLGRYQEVVETAAANWRLARP